jgi:hypothetical protein
VVGVRVRGVGSAHAASTSAPTHLVRVRVGLAHLDVSRWDLQARVRVGVRIKR